MRLCIFAHYDPEGKIDPHVLYHLQALKPLCDRLVFVSTADLRPAEIQKAAEICSDIIPRRNEGFDFYSYRTGLFHVSDWRNYEEVLFCNDSIYGPIFDLKALFTRMESKVCDFWALTSNKQFRPHLQSFFMVFKKTCVASEAFENFWKGIEILKDKNAVIQKYELQFQNYFESKGFKSAVFHEESLKEKIATIPIALKKTLGILRRDPKQLVHITRHLRESSHLNKTHYFAGVLIAHKVPYMKVELFRDNPEKQNLDKIRQQVEACSSYPLPLIADHVKRTKNVR